MTSRENTTAFYRRSAEFCPPGEPGQRYRPLSAEERKALERQGNTAADWSLLEVAEGFRPGRVHGCRFFGRVRLGVFEDTVLSAGELSLPAGLYGSTLAACTAAGNCAVHQCGYISHCYIGREALLFRVDQLTCAASPSFGMGSGAEGEGVVIEAVNENGSRPVRLHPQTVSADCFLQVEAVGDRPLAERLQALCTREADEAEEPQKTEKAEKKAGPVSTVSAGAAIITARRLHSVRIGAHARLRGPDLLEEVTVRSSREHPAEVGAGAQLRRGMIGFGAAVDSGAVAEDFFLADAASLSLGARLRHSVLGENSALDCAEVQHVLTAPFHAQHHNNSFLIAARLDGQSNLAAGATLGSNHNSRAADGELLAGRGFWPALSCSVKHNSRFTSYTLLTKAAYPAELDISLPFSLVSYDEREGRLLIMPGYWFMYNMYALARNALKFADRDRRPAGSPALETDFLAPDAAEEMLAGMELLESWAGRERLEAGEEELLVPAQTLERSDRRPRLLKAASGYRWYRRILQLYGIAALYRWRQSSGAGQDRLPEARAAAGEQRWRNLGGLLLPDEQWRRLRSDIVSGSLASWSEVHRRYAELSRRYAELKAAHGCALLRRLQGGLSEPPTEQQWRRWHREAAETLRSLSDAARESRQKDFRDPFRHITFSGEEEAQAVYGEAEEDRFLSAYRRRCSELADALEDTVDPGRGNS